MRLFSPKSDHGGHIHPLGHFCGSNCPKYQSETERHDILWQGIDYDVDQPMGWVVVCTCGEKFDHVAPEGARESFREHV